MTYLITDFGASTDPHALNTVAIQTAIDRCAANGGGKVIIPAGFYRSGTIRLRSHVELHLEQGAVLFASDSLADYNPLDEYPSNHGCPAEEWTGHHFIIAHQVEDASLTGPGTVNGNGDAFFCDPKPIHWICWREGLRTAKNKETLRPGQMIVFVECKNIRVTDLNVRNSPCWSIFLHACDRVQIRGVNILNGPADGCTDGIDIDCSSNVTVSDCVIKTGDDCITLRGDSAWLKPTHVCENVTISNCVMESSCSGMRIGVGTGVIRNAVIGNCVIKGCCTAFTIQSSWNASDASGVDISHIRIHHIDARDLGNAFWIMPGSATAIGRIRDVEFESCRFEAFCCSSVENTGDVRVRDIRFRDCDFVMINAPDGWLRPKDWYMPNAVAIVHADDVQFRDCRVIWNTDETFWEKAFHSDDTPGLIVRDCIFPQK